MEPLADQNAPQPLIITLNENPSYELSGPHTLPSFRRLEAVLEKFKTPNPFYDRVWIEASRDGVMVGYALLDLFSISETQQAKKGVPASEVKHAVDSVHAGHYGMVHSLEISNYDYEAIEEIKAAIDLLLWKRGVELGMDPDYLGTPQVVLRTATITYLGNR